MSTEPNLNFFNMDDFKEVDRLEESLLFVVKNECCVYFNGVEVTTCLGDVNKVFIVLPGINGTQTIDMTLGSKVAIVNAISLMIKEHGNHRADLRIKVKEELVELLEKVDAGSGSDEVIYLGDVLLNYQGARSGALSVISDRVNEYDVREAMDHVVENILYMQAMIDTSPEITREYRELNKLVTSIFETKNDMSIDSINLNLIFAGEVRLINSKKVNIYHSERLRTLFLTTREDSKHVSLSITDINTSSMYMLILQALKDYEIYKI